MSNVRPQIAMPINSVAAKWFRSVAVVALAGIGFVGAAFLQVFASESWGEWKALLNVGVLFAILGALYGSAVALDSQSTYSSANHPRTRVILCGLLGAGAVFVVWSWFPANFSILWLWAGAFVGATLGWYGWRWAKYVDF